MLGVQYFVLTLSHWMGLCLVSKAVEEFVEDLASWRLLPARSTVTPQLGRKHGAASRRVASPARAPRARDMYMYMYIYTRVVSCVI